MVRDAAATAGSDRCPRFGGRAGAGSGVIAAVVEPLVGVSIGIEGDSGAGGGGGRAGGGGPGGGGGAFAGGAFARRPRGGGGFGRRAGASSPREAGGEGRPGAAR